MLYEVITYLNEIYLGGRSYGVGSAALNYFNKSLPELDLSEAAILASLAKAPSAVNPYTNPEKLLARRNYVLGRVITSYSIHYTKLYDNADGISVFGELFVCLRSRLEISKRHRSYRGNANIFYYSDDRLRCRN